MQAQNNDNSQRKSIMQNQIMSIFLSFFPIVSVLPANQMLFYGFRINFFQFRGKKNLFPFN